MREASLFLPWLFFLFAPSIFLNYLFGPVVFEYLEFDTGKWYPPRISVGARRCKSGTIIWTIIPKGKRYLRKRTYHLIVFGFATPVFENNSHGSSCCICLEHCISGCSMQGDGKSS